MTRPPFHFSGTSIRNFAPLISPSSVFASAIAVEIHRAAQKRRMTGFFIERLLGEQYQKYNASGGLIAGRAEGQDRAGDRRITRNRGGYRGGSGARRRVPNRNSLWRISRGRRT